MKSSTFYLFEIDFILPSFCEDSFTGYRNLWLIDSFVQYLSSKRVGLNKESMVLLLIKTL